jgi:hypothetical protein
MKLTIDTRNKVRSVHNNKLDRAKAFCILRLIRDNPKGYRNILVNGSRLKQYIKYKQLGEWVESKTLIQSDSFVEKCYSAIYQDNGICKRGNQCHVDRFGDGFKYCGNKCECASETRSALCKASYQSRMK